MKAAFSHLKFNGMLKPGFQPASRRAEPKFLPDRIWYREIAFALKLCGAKTRSAVDAPLRWARKQRYGCGKPHLSSTAPELCSGISDCGKPNGEVRLYTFDLLRDDGVEIAGRDLTIRKLVAGRLLKTFK